MESNPNWKKLGIKRKLIVAILPLLLLGILIILPTGASAGINQWITNGPSGEDVVSMTISPNYASDRTIFAGTEYDGVFKSTNGGGSWSQVNAGLTSKLQVSLSISPNYASDRTLFAGTIGGVFKSTNGGGSWSQINSGLTGIVWSLVVSPNYALDETLFAGTSNGVYRSTNGGSSWNQVSVNSGLTGSVYSLAISPNYASDQTVFAGTEYDGIYKSTNGGGSWSQNSGLKDTIYTLVVSPNYASDKTLFAGTPDAGIYKSTNGGGSWSQINSGLGSNIWINALATSPNFASDQTLFAGTGGGVYKSTNGGASWNQLNSGLTNTDVRSLAESPNYTSNHALDQSLFAGTWGGGVFSFTFFGSSDTTPPSISNVEPSGTISTDSTTISNATISSTISANYSDSEAGGTGIDTSSVSVSLDGSILSGCAVTATSVSCPVSGLGEGNHIISGTVADNAGNTAAISGSFNVSFHNPVASLAISPNYASDKTLFAGTWYGGVFKLTNGGSWSQVNAGLGSNIWINALATSPNYASDQTLFAGTWGGGVFKSTNGGGSWSQVNAGLTGMDVYTLVVSPNYASDQTLFVGTDQNGIEAIYKSTDGGASWSLAETGLNDTDVSSLVISPNFASDQTLFAGTQAGGVWKSTDGGASWSIDVVLAAHVTLAISPNYASDQTLFAGTSYDGVSQYDGVFKSTNGGASWSIVGQTVPGEDVTSLAVSLNYAADQTLFAGTGGGFGVFESTNGGANWNQVNIGLTGADVYSLAVSPNFASNPAIFAGTDYGVLNHAFARETTPPSVSNVEPSGTIGTNSSTISANYSDSEAGGTGIDTSSVSVSLDGSILSGCAVTATSVSCPVSGLGEGNHIISGTVADNAGNTAAISGSFTVNGPSVSNVQPSGTIYTPDTMISANYVDNSDTGINTASVDVYLDGNHLSGCTPTQTSVSCQVTGLSQGDHTITGSVVANNGLTSQISGSFTLVIVRNYLWTWYDNIGGDNWLLFSNPVDAAGPLSYSLSIGGANMALPGSGTVGKGQTITPRYIVMNGPVVASSLTGGKGLVSQRILWPKGGNSLEEVLGTDESSLSNHFYWTWYDQQSSGMTDWVLIANPNDQAIYYEITIAGQDPGTGSKGYISGHQNVTPTFPGKMGGPVEVQAWTDNSKTTPVNVMASQRVLSNGGSAFNEVPGIPASQLSANNDYLWTWYDDVGGKDWLLVANTGSIAIHYTVKIGGVTIPGYDHRTLRAGGIETPRFGLTNGPIEVINEDSNGQLLASQRVVWGPSFEEVPGYPTGQLSSSYHWTWYDQAEGPGVSNWVLVANSNGSAVNYQVLIGGTVKAQGSIPANGRVTPSGLGIGGPVEVKACSANFTGPGQCPDSTPPNVMASQRVLWNGYFNEVLGTVLN